MSDDATHLPILLRQLPDDHEVVLVDRGAGTDTAAAVQARPSVRLLSQPGATPGRALAAGLAAATGDVIATFPVDGSADPAELPRFVAAIEQGADFAKGSRFLDGGGASDATSLEVASSRVVSWLGHHAARIGLSDPAYGFYAISGRLRDRLLDVADLHTPQIATVVALRLVAVGARVVEVPSVQRFRIFGRSRRLGLVDGVRDARLILAERSRVSPVRRDHLETALVS
ncbi:glycosyltransferase [Nocardioides sp.]|uniref:glycosyltransferase n=1 Tax=Nocardioides sp. TaxID=35761 RepID=UPI0039E51AC2